MFNNTQFRASRGTRARSHHIVPMIVLATMTLGAGCHKDTPVPPSSSTAINAPLEEFKAKQARADQGDATAQFQVGMAYESGKNVPQSYIQAAKWFRKSADQGHEKAQFNLGVMASLGRGMATNDTEAIHWWQKSAEQGNARAQNNLGFAFANGRGATQNYAEAAKWLGRSADQGFAQAQFNYGGLFFEGKGVATNYVEAYKWFSLAALQRYPRAEQYVVEVGTKLSGEEMATALREARAWRAAHPNVLPLPTNSVANRFVAPKTDTAWSPPASAPANGNATKLTNLHELTPTSLVPPPQ